MISVSEGHQPKPRVVDCLSMTGPPSGEYQDDPNCSIQQTPRHKPLLELTSWNRIHISNSSSSLAAFHLDSIP